MEPPGATEDKGESQGKPKLDPHTARASLLGAGSLGRWSGSCSLSRSLDCMLTRVSPQREAAPPGPSGLHVGMGMVSVLGCPCNPGAMEMQMPRAWPPG